jgi:hypothetical protein
MDDADEQALRCRRLQHAILKRALDDLRDLRNQTSIEHPDEDRPMNCRERAALLDETREFFLGRNRSAYSLDALCDSLDLNAERVRARARGMLAGDPGSELPRRRVTPDETAAILACLAAGESSTRLGARFGLDPATVRKVRIRARKRAQFFNPVPPDADGFAAQPGSAALQVSLATSICDGFSTSLPLRLMVRCPSPSVPRSVSVSSTEP